MNTARAIPGSAEYFSEQPISKEQIGAWLSRFAQVRQQRQNTFEGDIWETARRGAPEGGGMAALGATLAIERCVGVEPGLYDYAARGHRLEPRRGDPGPFIKRAEQSMDFANGRPAGVMIITSDMRRMTAKYHRTALSISLLNAGVWIAAAYAIGREEGIAVRALGKTDGETWIRYANLPIAELTPVASIAFGIERQRPRNR